MQWLMQAVTLFTWKTNEERKTSVIYHLLQIIMNTIVNHNDVVIILAFTGLNSTKISEFEPLSGAKCKNYDLNLLKVDEKSVYLLLKIQEGGERAARNNYEHNTVVSELRPPPSPNFKERLIVIGSWTT